MADENIFEYFLISLIQHHTDNDKSTEETLRSLDSLGFRVGYNLVERMVPDTLRLTDEISIMKYLCKEFWTSLFSKQIDNLRTNNSGIFVLQDNNFKPLAQFAATDETNKICQNYLAFTCGLIRGTLANFGYSNIVTSDTRSLPCCKFQINLSTNLANQKKA